MNKRFCSTPLSLIKRLTFKSSVFDLCGNMRLFGIDHANEKSVLEHFFRDNTNRLLYLMMIKYKMFYYAYLCPSAGFGET